MARAITEIMRDLERTRTEDDQARDIVRAVADMADPTEADLNRQDEALATVESATERVHLLRSELEDAVLNDRGAYTEPGDQRPRGYRPEIRRHGDDEQGRALDLIERSNAAERLSHDDAERLTRSIERADASDPIAAHIVRTGSDEYRSAFLKLFTDMENGHRMWTPAELDAFQKVQTINRAMNIGTGSAGGYLVPYELDPQIRLTSGGAIDPMRQLATVRQTAANDLHVVTSAGVTTSWDAEAAEVSDDSPTIGPATVSAFKGQGFIPVSVELFEDANFLTRQVADLFADAKQVQEAAAFAVGTGSGQPEGVITGVVAAAVSGQLLTSSGSALAVADVTAVMNAVPARFRANANFMANLSIINQGRTTPRYSNGPALVDDSTTPPKLMGWNIYENSNVDGTIAAGTTHDYVLLAGDFQRGYVITDRIGTSVELVPHLFGASGRPTGQRGFWMHWRTGGKTVVPQAFALMDYSA